MERIKVGTITGATEKLLQIKKIIDSTKKGIKKNDELEKAEIKFEKIMGKENPDFEIQDFSSDARCELPLLPLFEVDEVGNFSLEAEKFFNVGKTSILTEMAALFGMEFVLATE